MSYHFCTIITRSHLAWARVLGKSLRRYETGVRLHVLISDAKRDDLPESDETTLFYTLRELEEMPIVGALEDKYSENSPDAFRWSLKPVFVEWLLTTKGLDSVAYADSDLYFTDHFAFLFEWREGAVMKLFPHFRPISPRAGGLFINHINQGMFNGGFFMARAGAQSILEWWADCCLERCDISEKEGFYVDQRYLDLAAVYFDGVEISRHRGCNVAGWNIDRCPRTVDDRGNVYCGGDPLIFIHFTAMTIRRILWDRDSLLKPYLLRLKEDLAHEGFSLSLELRKPSLFHRLRMRLRKAISRWI